jgi:hypothetical protein
MTDDRLLRRDALEDTPECDRGKLISLCLEYIIHNEIKNSGKLISFCLKYIPIEMNEFH